MAYMQKKSFKYFFTRFVLFCACAGIVFGVSNPSLNFAQVLPELVTADDITVELEPRVPGPYEKVDLTLKSFVINPDTSYITWIVNGENVGAETGLKRMTVTTGDIGEPVFIEIRIRYQQLEEVVKRIRLQPGSLDVLWQAENSYTPPFYRGKALPSSESTLKVLALPFDFTENDQYNYIWEYQAQVDQASSGFRENIYRIDNRFFDKGFLIDVTATRRDGGFQATQELSLPRYDPEVHFIAYDPFGTKQKIQNGSLIIDDEYVLLEAVPYYFSTNFFSRDVLLEWEIDRVPYFSDPGDDLRYNQIFLSPADGSGSSRVEAKILHDKKLLQEAERGITVRY